MSRSISCRLWFSLVVTALVAASLGAQQPPLSRPDLVVVISIDQFPYGYIPRFRPYFSEGGFNRFLQHGASFTHALYPYATTFTGPGHAAIGTGYTPSRSGIVGNSWFDRTTGAAQYCVEDARATGGFSPLNLASDSLGDRVQEKYPGAKVFGISLKDRAAILMAGRKATAAYWFDSSATRFTSSSYYRYDRALLDEYNKTIPDWWKAHPTWTQSEWIPAADLEKITHDPERLRKYKSQREGLGVSFPHPIKTIDLVTYTPFGNALVINLVEKVIEKEGIGTEDGTPDLVFMSLSSPDYLGHYFGPDSLEAADTVVRTDRDLADFFNWLERHFGDRVTVALSADHGVQSIPEVARDLGRLAGRVDMRNPGANIRTFGELAEVSSARAQLEKLVAQKLELAPIVKTSDVSQGLLLYFEEPGFIINWVRVRELKLDGERVKRAIRDAAKQLEGVAAAFTNTELLMTNREPSALERAVRLSFRADRSPDVILALQPGYIWNYGGTGTTHGQPVEADQHVPLMLWGRGVKSGTYDDEVAPTDLAKTLGTLLGVEAGGAETQVLPCL